MTLNHLNLTVVSPDETSAFLAKYFDLRPGGGNSGMQMLSDDKGMVLTLMKARAEDRDQGSKHQRQRSAHDAASHRRSQTRPPARPRRRR